MPVSKYDRFFGGKKGSARKAKRAMADTYGEEEGERVFYATKNKRKNEGGPRGITAQVRDEREKRRGKRGKRGKRGRKGQDEEKTGATPPPWMKHAGGPDATKAETRGGSTSAQEAPSSRGHGKPIAIARKRGRRARGRRA